MRGGGTLKTRSGGIVQKKKKKEGGTGRESYLTAWGAQSRAKGLRSGEREESLSEQKLLDNRSSGST